MFGDSVPGDAAPQQSPSQERISEAFDDMGASLFNPMEEAPGKTLSSPSFEALSEQAAVNYPETEKTVPGDDFFRTEQGHNDDPVRESLSRLSNALSIDSVKRTETEASAFQLGKVTTPTLEDFPAYGGVTQSGSDLVANLLDPIGEKTTPGIPNPLLAGDQLLGGQEEIKSFTVEADERATGLPLGANVTTDSPILNKIEAVFDEVLEEEPLAASLEMTRDFSSLEAEKGKGDPRPWAETVAADGFGSSGDDPLIGASTLDGTSGLGNLLSPGGSLFTETLTVEEGKNEGNSSDNGLGKLRVTDSNDLVSEILALGDKASATSDLENFQEGPDDDAEVMISVQALDQVGLDKQASELRTFSFAPPVAEPEIEGRLSSADLIPSSDGNNAFAETVVGEDYSTLKEDDLKAHKPVVGKKLEELLPADTAKVLQLSTEEPGATLSSPPASHTLDGDAGPAPIDYEDVGEVTSAGAFPVVVRPSEIFDMLGREKSKERASRKRPRPQPSPIGHDVGDVSIQESLSSEDLASFEVKNQFRQARSASSKAARDKVSRTAELYPSQDGLPSVAFPSSDSTDKSSTADLMPLEASSSSSEHRSSLTPAKKMSRTAEFFPSGDELAALESAAQSAGFDAPKDKKNVTADLAPISEPPKESGERDKEIARVISDTRANSDLEDELSALDESLSGTSSSASYQEDDEFEEPAMLPTGDLSADSFSALQAIVAKSASKSDLDAAPAVAEPAKKETKAKKPAQIIPDEPSGSSDLDRAFFNEEDLGDFAYESSGLHDFNKSLKEQAEQQSRTNRRMMFIIPLILLMGVGLFAFIHFSSKKRVKKISKKKVALAKKGKVKKVKKKSVGRLPAIRPSVRMTDPTLGQSGAPSDAGTADASKPVALRPPGTPEVREPVKRPKVEKPKPRIRKPKPRIRKPKPRIRKPKPRIRKPKPRIRKPKPRVRKPKRNPRLAKRYYKKAMSSMMAGKLPKAERYLKRSIRADSRHADAYRVLGLIYFRQKKKAKAKRALRRFLRLSPKHPTAPGIRGILKTL